MHVYIYDTCTYILACIHTYICVYIHIDLCVCLHTYISTYSCMSACMNMDVKHTYIHTPSMFSYIQQHDYICII